MPLFIPKRPHVLGGVGTFGGQLHPQIFDGKNPTKTKRNNDTCQIWVSRPATNLPITMVKKTTYKSTGSPSEPSGSSNPEVVRGFTCLEDTLDHYFSPRIIEDGGLRVKTMRKFRRMYPWMGI